MKIQQFLEHHGVQSNPFAEEDAQSDLVFKQHCIDSTYHPTWDKIYGDPAEPSTSIVFGEKGAGKTAIRLQIVKHLAEFNRSHPNERMYVIEYDDFNPFLDRFRDRLSIMHRRPDRALAEWKLWDHMDAILTIGVTSLVDRILKVDRADNADLAKLDEVKVQQLDRHQSRDLLLLAACYDQSSAETSIGRWHRLRRRLGFSIWKSRWDFALGLGVTIFVLALTIGLQRWEWFEHIWIYLAAAAGWAAWSWRFLKRFWQSWGIVRHVRTGNLRVTPVRQMLMNLTDREVSGQPLPNKNRTDDRYELLSKFQGVLRTLRFAGIIVLVDRVDEPHLINGSADQMRALLWPMLDNKFLKQSGIALKLLLPIELVQYVDREDRDFYQRARLDKQNMITSLEWTGPALYDVANARLRACAANGAAPKLKELFAESVSEPRLIEALRSLRVPRHLFKFMYRLFVAHCNTHTDEQPVWKISSEMFESHLSRYLKEQDAFDRGLGAG